MNRREALKHSTLVLGYTLSASGLSQIWSGCSAKSSSDWQPGFFSDEQFETISAMAECILPTTDTPGARDLRVDRFVDRFIKNIYPQGDQEQLRAEMEDFTELCRKDAGDTFASLSEEQQAGFLLSQESAANTVNHSIWGETTGTQDHLPFYRKIKSLALLGYFTSEEVGENQLTYEPVPGTQVGCVPLSDVGKAYSL